MTSSRKYAEIAAAALGKMLRAGADSGKVADIVESVLADATRERDEDERQHLAEVEAAAATRLSRLLDASPAVIYSFEAKGDFAPTFVSENIMRLFGYAARANISKIRISGASACIPTTSAHRGRNGRACSNSGHHAIEYRFRQAKTAPIAG